MQRYALEEWDIDARMHLDLEHWIINAAKGEQECASRLRRRQPSCEQRPGYDALLFSSNLRSYEQQQVGAYQFFPVDSFFPQP